MALQASLQPPTRPVALANRVLLLAGTDLSQIDRPAHAARQELRRRRQRLVLAPTHGLSRTGQLRGARLVVLTHCWAKRYGAEDGYGYQKSLGCDLEGCRQQ